MKIEEVRKYKKLSLIAKQLVEGFITGLHKSPYHGFSVEFSEYLLYNFGDSTRNIDWKVFARTDKLFVKRYEEETNLRCMILLDVSSSMFYPMPHFEKLRFSVLAAACLTYLLQRQRDAVGLTTFSETIETITPIKSSLIHRRNIFNLLQKIYLENKKIKNKKTAVARVLHQTVQQIHKRSLVIIFSDMMDNVEEFEEIFSALRHLKHNKHEVIVIHIFDPKTELEFAFDERPIKFIDRETGVFQKTFPSQIREEYKKLISKRIQEIALRCAQFKIDFLPIDCREHIEKTFIPYFFKRAKMK